MELNTYVTSEYGHVLGEPGGKKGRLVEIECLTEKRAGNHDFLPGMIIDLKL